MLSGQDRVNGKTHETEEKLSEESTDRVGDLDTKVLVVGVGTTLVVNKSDHGRGKRDCEDVVRVGEESDTCGMASALSLCAECMHNSSGLDHPPWLDTMVRIDAKASGPLGSELRVPSLGRNLWRPHVLKQTTKVTHRQQYTP